MSDDSWWEKAMAAEDRVQATRSELLRRSNRERRRAAEPEPERPREGLVTQGARSRSLPRSRQTIDDLIRAHRGDGRVWTRLY